MPEYEIFNGISERQRSIEKVQQVRRRKEYCTTQNFANSLR